jgi:nitrate reductase delta subunit
MRRHEIGTDAARVVRQAASWCLSYPDESLKARLPLIRDALVEHDRLDGFGEFLDFAEPSPLAELQQRYVDIFDLSRKHALYLSYWTDGDTRRRGEVLASFKEAYRRSGYLVDTGGELPDYLPMVLEFAAVADPVAGSGLLQRYRPSLELLRLALSAGATDAGPYAGVVAAVCRTLPGPSPADRAAVQAMAAGPPAESVGLEPFDPRLLSLSGDAGRERT